MATTSLDHADASTNGVRSSGRVRVQPGMYTSSPVSSNGKRKRDEAGHGADDDLDEGADDNEDDDDDDAEEDEPAEEEVREQRRRARRPRSTAPRKPAQKKPRVNGVSLPVRSAPGAKKKAPKKAKGVTKAEAEEIGGLYAEIFASGNTLEDIAAQWLLRFGEHESRALAEVVNFVLACAGCSGRVVEHDIEDPDGVTNKLDDLRDEYQASNPTEYPLIAKGKATAAFKQSICGFMEALVKAMAANDLLYTEPVLMENILNWISTMSSAPNRSFRHTATVVSLSIATALCEVARENAKAVADHQRHAETERKKKAANKGRVSHIQQKVKEKTAQQETIEPLLKEWFETVWIHRYRDVDPVIRRDCMAALGEWIVMMPDVFFNSEHLRYMGWMLSDANPATRAEVVNQLHRLYKEKTTLGGLKTFTEKFRSRMVEIATTDAETNVRSSGIELMDLLREGGLLEPDDVDAVGRLIFDTEERVRKTVAPFFTENVNDTYSSKIDDLGGLENLTEALPEVGDGNYEVSRLEWLKFKSLAEILQNYDTDDNLPSQVQRISSSGGYFFNIDGGDSRFTLAADVLYEKLNELQDWQVLAGYLLFDHSSGRANGVATDPLSQLKHESVLTEKEESILLEVLNATVKRALLETAEKLKAPKTKITVRQREQLEEEQEEAARHLTSVIPKLLKKFGDLPSTAAAVLRVEAVLNQPDLKHLRQDSATYATLLDDVRKQFMSHGTDEVLAPASSAILHAKSYGELDDVTEERVGALWEDVVSNLAELLNPTTISVRGSSSSEELVALSNNLLRIIRLAAVSDCVSSLEDSSVVTAEDADGVEYTCAIDYIIALIKRAEPATGPALDIDDAALEDQIAGRAAEASLFYCRWKVKGIIAAVTTSASAGVAPEELEALAIRRDNCVANLQSALMQRKGGEDVSVALADCLLEVYTLAAILKGVKRKPGMADDYTALIMELTSDQERSIMRVFAAAEQNFAKLSGKKLEAAAAGNANGNGDLDADAVDDDPMSDPESDDEDDEATQDPTQTQASQQRKDAKIMGTILAEQKLCELTGKIIHALHAGVIDEATVRERLGRNKARLGPNFKQVVEYLDVGKNEEKKKGKARKAGGTKAKANGVNGKVKSHPKSNAIVAEDELDDEIEDIDADDHEAMRRMELVDDNEREDEQEEEELVDGAGAEDESVLGD